MNNQKTPATHWLCQGVARLSSPVHLLLGTSISTASQRAESYGGSLPQGFGHVLQLFPAKCGESYRTHYLQDVVRCNDVCKATGSPTKKSPTRAASAPARFADAAVKEVRMQMGEPPPQPPAHGSVLRAELTRLLRNTTYRNGTTGKGLGNTTSPSRGSPCGTYSVK